MNTIIKQKLELLEKPNICDYTDKDCVICLQSLESGLLTEQEKLVQLPCKCGNSIYHTECIQKLVLSRYNDNCYPYSVCPYCNRNYQLFTNDELSKLEKNIYEINRRITNKILCDRNFNVFVMFVHVVFNSILNIILINLNDDSNINEMFSHGLEKAILTSGHLAKIFLNIALFGYVPTTLDNIDLLLLTSYFCQSLLFGVTMILQDSIIYSKYLIMKKIYIVQFVLVGILLFKKIKNFIYNN